MQIPGLLIEQIRREAGAAAPNAFMELAEGVRAACDGGVEAILLYGSCLRTGDAATGVVDLLVIIGDYGQMPCGRVRRALNATLPPGVYYMERHDSGGRLLRCKYAVISLRDFEAGTRHWLQPYLWARFAQPARLLFARDEAVRSRVCESLAAAVTSFLRNVTPLMAGERLTAADIWRRGLALTYGVELRPEGADRPESIVEADADYWARMTACAEGALGDLLSPADDGAWRLAATATERRRCLRRWRLRRWQGPILSVLRWIKAAFTFTGGVDYAAWKIERHTGVRIEVTERLRRRPLIYGWALLWRLWRSGALR